MTFLRKLFRCYSFAFHALFVFVATAMAVVFLASGPHRLNFFLLPWTGSMMVYGLIAMALIGATILLLAHRGKMQILFVLWSLLVLVLVVRYFFFSQYMFTPGTGELRFALWVVALALLAAVGATLRPSAKSH